MQHTQVEAYLVQRAKFKYCFFVSIFTTALIFLSTFIHMNVNFDTFDKEERTFFTYSHMKERYKPEAEEDARDHNISEEMIDS